MSTRNRSERAGSASAPDPLRVPLSIAGSNNPEWSAALSASQISPASPLAVAGIFIDERSETRVQLLFSNTREGVLVSGQIQAPWLGPCARCAVEVPGVATIEVSELFCANPTEGEQYPLEEDYLDLAPMLSEVILLELPLHGAPCPHPDPCPNAVELPASTSDEGETADASADGSAEGEAPRDERWAALDILRSEPRETGD